MIWWADVALLVGAYLLGAAPVVYAIGHFRGLNAGEVEDMHIALWQRGGRPYGALAVLWDMSKGVIAVMIARALDFPPYMAAAAGLAAVIGQMWPALMKGMGEKGNSTGLAMILAVSPKAFIPSIIIIVIAFSIRTLPRLLSRRQTTQEKLKFAGPPSLSLPLGMLIAFAVMPVSHWLFYPDEVAVALVLAGLWVAIAVRRVTADLREELTSGADVKSILLNRFLFDRSFI